MRPVLDGNYIHITPGIWDDELIKLSEKLMSQVFL
jgi:hypothetical protein